MFQKIIIVGNLGGDPEMRYTPSGQAVTNFSVAVNEGWGDSKRTIWFRVSCWRKLAETMNDHLKKGTTVLVEGTLSSDDNGGPRIWTGKDGETRASFEITANTVRFLSSKGNDSKPDTDDSPF